MTEFTSSTGPTDSPLSAAYEQGSATDGDVTTRTVTINRSLEELQAFLRTASNVQLLFSGELVDAEALVIEALADGAVGLRSGANAKHEFSGRIDLAPAPAGRGVEVRITLDVEDRTLLGKAVDKLRKYDPVLETRRALRRFKQLMETGEIATAQPPHAAPRG